MPDGTPPIARQLERGRFNRFLAILPPHDFSLLALHLRTVTLERGVMLHDATGIRGASGLADPCQRGVAKFARLSYRKRSRPVEGFATGRDCASTVSGAIFPSAPQSHCPTADRSCGSCTVPRRLRNR
jgi:hypothetical protein